MPFKRLMATLAGVAGIVWLMTASDVTGVQPKSFHLKQEVNVAELDGIADQTHGVLKWSHGAFLYEDTAGGLAPTFHTLDREGRLISSVTLNIPGATQFWGGSFDRGSDGTVVFGGGTYSEGGQGAPLIAWIASNGETERVLRTAPYYPHMVSVAPDGTVWTMGCEMIDHKADAPELDPNAGALRHFDQAGKLLGSFLPQSHYVADHKVRWLESGRIVAKSDRIGWYAPIWGHPGRYAEILLETMTEKTYLGLPALGKYAHVSSLALTDDGTATMSVNDPESPQNWINYALDRAASKWIPVQVAVVSGFPPPSVMGSDANQLVLRSGRGAVFFSVSH